VDRTVLTCYPGHAAELAAEGQNYAGVAAIGGDGTLFEILKGIHLEEQRVALIPAGRGNSLARELGLLRRRAPLDVINWGEARHIDLMEVRVITVAGLESTHLSASTIAIGYAASAVIRARKLAWMGRYSYASAATTIRPAHFGASIQYGDQAPRRLWLSGFIANNTRYLASFLAFHQGYCNDGWVDIMELDAGLLKQTLHNVSSLSGARFYEPYPPIQVRSARVHLDKPQDLMMDGEIFQGVVSLDIRILPSALAFNGPVSQ
jgi:diacylglycerol kinase (ATP)